jgi:hypothetical protein
MRIAQLKQNGEVPVPKPVHLAGTPLKRLEIKGLDLKCFAAQFHECERSWMMNV